jgi:hypothetical protein
MVVSSALGQLSPESSQLPQAADLQYLETTLTRTERRRQGIDVG